MERVSDIRVLYVEDDPDFADTVAARLERESDRITADTAASADEGIDRLRANDIDCIVSEYDLPDSNGLELLTTVREHEPELPFVLFTGEGDERIASEAIGAGVTDYVRKDGGDEQYGRLFESIQNGVDRYRRRQDRQRRFGAGDSPAGGTEASDGEFVDGDEPNGDVEVELKTRAMDTAPVGITISDPSRRDNPLIYANERFESLTGYDRDAVAGRNCRFLQGPDTDPARVAEFRNAIEAEERVSVELRNYRKNGAEFWNRVTIAPITDEDGTVTNYVGFQQDVTERKEVEQRLQALFENAPIAIAFTEFEDGMPIIRSVNPTFERTFGYDSETAVGQDLDDLLLPGTEESNATEINHRVQDGDQVEVEVRRETTDGLHDFILHAVPLQPGERNECCYAIYQDITDRAERERAVDRLHSTVQSFLQAETAAEIGEIAVEAARDILDLPASSVHLYDEREDHLAPVAWTERAAEIVGELPTFEPGEGLAWRAFETGEVQVFSDVSAASGRINPDTDVRSEIILPLDDQGVLIIGSDTTGAFDPTDISFAQTLTAHMTTALNSLERERQLERQNERLDEFIGIVSHDLRSPLSVAQGRLELAATECDSPHLEDAANAVDRSLTLVSDLLTLAREGEEINEVESVALGDAVAGSWQTIDTANATLDIETEQQIQADPSRLKQLLENLLRNAIEHGDTDVTITIGDLEDGFYIADDGPGIAESDREQVFEAGYSTAEQSTGFGLNIVQEIATAHDWTVQIADSERGGARFEITGVKQVSGETV